MGSREGAAKARATFLARVRAGEIRVTGKAGASGVGQIEMPGRMWLLDVRHGDDVVERRSVMIYGDKRAAYDGTIACAARAVLLFTQET